LFYTSHVSKTCLQLVHLLQKYRGAEEKGKEEDEEKRVEKICAPDAPRDATWPRAPFVRVKYYSNLLRS